MTRGMITFPYLKVRNMSDVINTTDQDFEEIVLKSDKVVLLDFWAEWCTPCKKIAPILELIASENKAKIKVVKINIDEYPITSTKYAVMSIPTLLVFKNGEVVQKIVGGASKLKLMNLLVDYI
jgi:thioredoxin 1